MGLRPQVHLGKSGGQVQPFTSWAMNCFTVRSSREWKLIATSLPPGLSRGTTDLVEFSNVRNLLRWKVRGTGPLSSNVGEGGGFLRTRDDLPAPDIQYHVAPAGFYDNGLREPTRRMFTAAPTLVSVRSRGSLTLRSADPAWHPEIDAAYFDDGADLDAMIAGARRLWEICTQGPLAKHLDEEILAIAERHGLAVIEDACQAHGATYHGRQVGSIGVIGCYSLNSSKILSGGEGGLLVADDPALLARARRLRTFGEDIPELARLTGWNFRPYTGYSIGWNYRHQEMPAALARSQLRRLPEYIEIGQQNAANRIN